MTEKFIFYDNESHGYLQVSISDLKELGIQDKITGCSFQKGNDVYLEEDCDASIFIKAWKEKTGKLWNDVRYTIKNVSHNYFSSYNHYYFETNPDKIEFMEKVKKHLLKNQFKKGSDSTIEAIENGDYLDCAYWNTYYKLGFDTPKEPQNDYQKILLFVE